MVNVFLDLLVKREHFAAVKSPMVHGSRHRHDMPGNDFAIDHPGHFPDIPDRAGHRYEDAVFVSALEPPAVDELKTKFVELVESYRSGRLPAG